MQVNAWHIFFKIFPGIQRRDISDLGGTGKASWKMWHFDVSVSLMKKDTEGQKDIQTEEEHAGSCDILTSMAWFCTLNSLAGVMLLEEWW